MQLNWRVSSLMHSRRRQILAAFLVSGLLHGGLVLGIAWVALRSAWPPPRDVQTAVRPVDFTADAAAAVTSDEFPGDETAPEEAADALDVLAAADAHDPQLSEFARDRLEREHASASGRSAAENLTELETLGQQLTSISSQKSIADMSAVIAPWIGSDATRATEPDPAASDAELFEVKTAQVSDVLRQETEGHVQYVAVLVDAAGRTQETLLETADGESLFETFQLMKKFPLLEAVYRKSVMGLLDRLMEEQPATPQIDTHSAPAEPSGDDQQAQQHD